ncbi:MAG: hypothetical protein HY720_12125 [Planctomycetes bacterium]|nr:hypothetical protein [Planctomycetota bacterium]
MMKRTGVRIDWSCPPPRKGLAGALDRFVGPGATRAEILLQFGVAFAAGVAVLALAPLAGLDWPWWRLAVAALLAFDLAGGVATNSTSSAKRWVHTKFASPAKRLALAATHVHPFLVAWLFRSGDWPYGAACCLFVLAAEALILATPLYLQRPVAFVLAAVAIAGERMLFEPAAGLSWFAPLFFLKTVVSIPLREEPYRPDEPGAGTSAG